MTVIEIINDQLKRNFTNKQIENLWELLLSREKKTTLLALEMISPFIPKSINIINSGFFIILKNDFSRLAINKKNGFSELINLRIK